MDSFNYVKETLESLSPIDIEFGVAEFKKDIFGAKAHVMGIYEEFNIEVKNYTDCDCCGYIDQHPISIFVHGCENFEEKTAEEIEEWFYEKIASEL